MIVEYTRYKIDEQRRGTFEKAYKKAVEPLAASSHCLAFELSHCTEAPDYYVLRIEWDSEEGHLKGFRSSTEFESFFSSIQPYVKDIEEMRHYQVLSAGGNAHSNYPVGQPLLAVRLTTSKVTKAARLIAVRDFQDCINFRSVSVIRGKTCAQFVFIIRFRVINKWLARDRVLFQGTRKFAQIGRKRSGSRRPSLIDLLCQFRERAHRAQVGLR